MQPYGLSRRQPIRPITRRRKLKILLTTIRKASCVQPWRSLSQSRKFATDKNDFPSNTPIFPAGLSDELWQYSGTRIVCHKRSNSTCCHCIPLNETVLCVFLFQDGQGERDGGNGGVVRGRWRVVLLKPEQGNWQPSCLHRCRPFVFSLEGGMNS